MTRLHPDSASAVTTHYPWHVRRRVSERDREIRRAASISSKPWSRSVYARTSRLLWGFGAPRRPDRPPGQHNPAPSDTLHPDNSLQAPSNTHFGGDRSTCRRASEAGPRRPLGSWVVWIASATESPVPRRALRAQPLQTRPQNPGLASCKPKKKRVGCACFLYFLF